MPAPSTTVLRIYEKWKHISDYNGFWKLLIGFCEYVNLTYEWQRIPNNNNNNNNNNNKNNNNNNNNNNNISNNDKKNFCKSTEYLKLNACQDSSQSLVETSICQKDINWNVWQATAAICTICTSNHKRRRIKLKLNISEARSREYYHSYQKVMCVAFQV